MHYRSLSDLAHTVRIHLSKIPLDVDLVVGVPRSGLLVANMLALTLNVALTDISGLIENRRLQGGQRWRRREINLPQDAHHVLIVDDSILWGDAMARARDLIAKANLPCRVTFLAAYAAPQSAHLVDIHFEQVPTPRMFEWNVMNHELLARCCVDIDGILCVDPTYEENDDGPRYLEFLRAARPLFTTNYEIGHLVTSRLERYRGETEAWLKSQGVRYSKLHMLDLPDAETRRRLNAHARFKASIYRRCADAELFIESDPEQALEISNLSGKPALCLPSSRMYTPGMSVVRMDVQSRAHIRNLIWRTRRKLVGMTS